MAFNVEERNPQPENSRILFSKDIAFAFRKVCKYAKKSPSDVLREMIVRYIKSEKLPIRLVKDSKE